MSVHVYVVDFVHKNPDMCPTSTLHGISAMGTEIAFYSLDLQSPQAPIVPQYIPRDLEMGNDPGVPREQWSLDVLSEEGEIEIRRVADEIKAECQPWW